MTRDERRQHREGIIQQLETGVDDLDDAAFDLDEIADSDLDLPPRPEAPYTLADLGNLLLHPELLPDGLLVKPMGHQEYELALIGIPETVRVTTNPQYYDSHPSSTELWSPGSPLFPTALEGLPASDAEESPASLREILSALG